MFKGERKEWMGDIFDSPRTPQPERVLGVVTGKTDTTGETRGNFWQAPLKGRKSGSKRRKQRTGN